MKNKTLKYVNKHDMGYIYNISIYIYIYIYILYLITVLVMKKSTQEIIHTPTYINTHR